MPDPMIPEPTIPTRAMDMAEDASGGRKRSRRAAACPGGSPPTAWWPMTDPTGSVRAETAPPAHVHAPPSACHVGRRGRPAPDRRPAEWGASLAGAGFRTGRRARALYDRTAQRAHERWPLTARTGDCRPLLEAPAGAGRPRATRSDRASTDGCSIAACRLLLTLAEHAEARRAVERARTHRIAARRRGLDRLRARA